MTTTWDTRRHLSLFVDRRWPPRVYARCPCGWERDARYVQLWRGLTLRRMLRRFRRHSCARGR